MIRTVFARKSSLKKYLIVQPLPRMHNLYLLESTRSNWTNQICEITIVIVKMIKST